MSDDLKDQGFVMIGMNGDDMAPDELKPELEAKDVNWRQALLDPGDHPVFVDYPIPYWPTKVVIDRKGRVVAINPDDYRAAVESVL